MKIALVSQPFDVFVPPRMNSIGIWINEISRQLAREHDVIVYGRRGLADRGEIGKPVVTRYVRGLPARWWSRIARRLDPYRSAKKPLFSSLLYELEYILPIALDLRRRRVEIVHLQNYSQFAPVIRLFNPRIKIVLHMRCEWLSLLDEQMIDRRLRQVDLILGVSQYITDQIRARFPQHAERCAVAYTGIDTEVFRPPESEPVRLAEPVELAEEAERAVRARPDGYQRAGERAFILPTGGAGETGGAEKTGGASLRILFVGRITPEKGVHVLLEAFQQIAGLFPNLELDLVGSVGSLPRQQLVGMSESEQIRSLDAFYTNTATSYIESLHSILPENLRERVHFVGNIAHLRTRDYYQNASVLVNPALSEPFGRSLIEANACGTPVIATRVDGMVELIEDGVNGLLVKPGEVADLASAMCVLLENEPLRRRMGRAGRAMCVAHFSWEKICDNLVGVYGGR